MTMSCTLVRFGVVKDKGPKCCKRGLDIAVGRCDVAGDSCLHRGING